MAKSERWRAAIWMAAEPALVVSAVLPALAIGSLSEVPLNPKTENWPGSMVVVAGLLIAAHIVNFFVVQRIAVLKRGDAIRLGAAVFATVMVASVLTLLVGVTVVLVSWSVINGLVSFLFGPSLWPSLLGVMLIAIFVPVPFTVMLRQTIRTWAPSVAGTVDRLRWTHYAASVCAPVLHFALPGFGLDLRMSLLATSLAVSFWLGVMGYRSVEALTDPSSAMAIAKRLVAAMVAFGAAGALVGWSSIR